MKFEEALARMNAGEAIRRPGWKEGSFLIKRGLVMLMAPAMIPPQQFAPTELMADDWEAGPVPEQYRTSAKAKKVYLLRVTAGSEDLFTVHNNPDAARIHLVQWCRLTWATYFGKEFNDWYSDQPTIMRDEAIIGAYFKASADMDACPARVTLVEVDMPPAPALKSINVIKTPGRTRALDLGAEGEGGEKA